jgi:hypothetical protein
VSRPAAASQGRLTSVRPLWAIEGGRLVLEGEGFPIGDGLPQVRIGPHTARIAAASSTMLSVIVPSGRTMKIETGACCPRDPLKVT